MRRIAWLIMLSLAALLLSSGAAIAQEEGECDTTVSESGSGSIPGATDSAADGDVVCIQPGDYDFSGQWSIETGITLRGLGDDPSDVTIDRSGYTGYSLLASADGLTFEDFELVGNPSADNAGYGIKAEDSDDLTLSGVAVEDAGRSGIDLNGIDGAVISDVRVQGAGGAGLAVTDSVGIDVQGLTATDNSWSGVALYGGQQNYFDRDMQGVDVFSITDSTLQGADLGLQIEDSSPNSDAEFGEITIDGVQFADNPGGQVVDMTNTTFEDGELQQILEDNSFDRAAVARENPIVGGAIFSSIHDAVDLAEASAATTVEVEPGTYPEHVEIDDTVELVGDTADRPVIQGSLDVRGNVSPNDAITDVVISDINIEASDGEVALIALSNLQGPYETQNLEVRNVDITTNGQSAIGLFDVDGVDLDNLDVDASGDDGGLGLVGVADLSLTDSSIDLEDGTGLALSHVEDYQPSGELTVSDVDFTSQAEATAVVDLALGPAAMDDVDVLLDGVDIQRPQARTVPSVQIAGRDSREERGVPQVTVRDSTINHSQTPPQPEQATSTVRVAGHVNLAVEESQLIGGPIGGYADAQLYAIDNAIFHTGDEGIWNDPGNNADIRLQGNTVGFADQTNTGSADIKLVNLPGELNQESDWDADSAALEICSTNNVASVLIGSDNANAFPCPQPPDLKSNCKQGGWQTMIDPGGGEFHNQGDCVSYFASGGKSRGPKH